MSDQTGGTVRCPDCGTLGVKAEDRCGNPPRQGVAYGHGKAAKNPPPPASGGSAEPVTRCPGWSVTPEEVAKWFHDEYERMAPTFSYKTREASAVPWENVPEDNRRLMMAVVTSVLLKWFPEHVSIPHDQQSSRADG